MNDLAGYDNRFIAETYDYVVPYRKRKDVDFFVDLAKEANGAVLELGCGTGRILIPTAMSGVDITGLDSSAEMLAVCHSSLEKISTDIQHKIHLIEADMRDFSIDRKFSLITIPFRAFHHLIETKDQIACLSCIYNHLQTGGRLIVDLFNPSLPYIYDKRFRKLKEEEPPFILPDGRKMLRRSRLIASDLVKQVIEIEFLYEWTNDKGKVKQRSHQFLMRYLFRYEVEHLLARTGFSLETVYADYKKSPFGSEYPGELIVIAKK
jgi:SAM-dependent methyltransferase